MKLPDTLQVMDHLYIKHLEFKKKTTQTHYILNEALSFNTWQHILHLTKF